jgi:hypothetical protein
MREEAPEVVASTYASEPGSLTCWLTNWPMTEEYSESASAERLIVRFAWMNERLLLADSIRSSMSSAVSK